jgi:hypothetical protein
LGLLRGGEEVGVRGVAARHIARHQRGRHGRWRLIDGFSELGVHVFVVVGTALGVVVGRRGVADLGKLGRHLNGGVHDGGEAAAVGAVFALVGWLAFLTPSRANGSVLLWLETLLLLCFLLLLWGEEFTIAC